MVYILYFGLLVSTYAKPQTEIYSSTAEVAYLIRTRQKVINELQSYIDEEEKRFSEVKRYYDVNIRENEKAMKNVSDYISNPINGFMITKSLTVDLNRVQYLIKKGSEIAERVTLKHESFVYPTVEDLNGTAAALSRLIKMYHLNVKELAEGKLNNDQRDLANAILWTQKILKIDPDQQKARHVLSAYFRRISDINKRNHNHEIEHRQIEQHLLEQYKKQGMTSEDLIFNYEEMCRGELDVPIEIYSRLTCRYLTERSPYLKIAPIKMETRYFNPEVVVFYNVVSDIEIDTVKKLSLPKFVRAKVAKSDPSISDDVRISKATWLKDHEFDILKRLSRRLAHITGLSLEESPDMQVCNYGLGGHFMPHFDPHDVTNKTYIRQGRRIATVMLYLSDVAQGGATVFPRIGVRVLPLKGAAVFWYNLHPSGEINEATLHAACPVLEGSKWVCNKWIFQAGQELHKPCDLQNQPQGYDMAIAPRPVPKLYRDRKLCGENEKLSLEASKHREAWFEDVMGTKNDN